LLFPGGNDVTAAATAATAITDAVPVYAALGWSQMLIPAGQKKTTDVGWPGAEDDPALLLRAAEAGGDWNLAVRLGARSGYLADVDLDSDAIRLLAPALLPPTPAVFGRTGGVGAPRAPTHRLYVCPDGPPGNGTVTLTGQTSLRWNGAYTVFPPSTHPDGSTYAWALGPQERDDDPAALTPALVRWGTLLEAVREVAAGALLLEAYPTWKQLRLRHYSTLAVAASLLRAGWEAPRVERFVYAVAVAAGDEEADARVTNVRTTADGLARGERYGGWSALVSNGGAGLVKRFQQFLLLDAYATQAGAWAAVPGVVSASNGSTTTPSPPDPAGSTAPTTPAQRTQAPRPVQTPSQHVPGHPGGAQRPQTPSAPVAPVIATAQQAASTAAAQTRQATLTTNEVALAVARVMHTAVPIARDEGQQLYHYAGGVYRSRGTELYLREKIAKEVIGHGAEYLNKGIEDEVLHRLLVGAVELEEVPNPWLLNLENGLLDLRTMVLGPHDPDVRTTLMLPARYDPGAGCPHIEAFCQQVFPPDAYAAGVPWEVIALCACAVVGIEKAVLLLGEGANGKSLYQAIVQALVGKHNSSTVSLQAIGGDRFATADLRGKLLNVSTDLPSRKVEDSGDFKAIVSREPIRAQRKNQPAFDFTPFCRLLYSANHLPESDDHSPGYVRRWHIIPFTQTFEPGAPLYRPRPELLAELTNPAELSGLLNRVIPAMLHFLAGGSPTSTDSMDAAVQEWVELSDDFGLWVASQLRVDPAGFVESGELASRWQTRQERRRQPGLVTGSRIKKAMAERFPKAVYRKQRVGGTGSGIVLPGGSLLGPQKRGYGGVSWKLSW
jgi:P4 family phage/plasmid primase-like protien